MKIKAFGTPIVLLSDYLHSMFKRDRNDVVNRPCNPMLSSVLQEDNLLVLDTPATGTLGRLDSLLVALCSTVLQTAH